VTEEAASDGPLPPAPRPKRRRWPGRLAFACVGAFASFVFLGFLVVPPVARSVAEKQLAQLLGRRVSIARVRFNPLALSVTVEGFQIFEPDARTPFVGFSRLYVNAQMSSVFRRAPVIAEVALESLRVHVVRQRATAGAFTDTEAAYNFSDILARLAARPKSPEPPSDSAPPRFSLNNLHLDDGAVIFDDGPTGDHHEITNLSIGIPFVSTLPVYIDSFVEPGLSVKIDGTTFAAQARSKPFKESRDTVLALRLQGLDLTRYLPFVPLRLPFTVRSARLSLALDVGFARAGDDAPRLTVKGNVGLEALDVEEKLRAERRPLLVLNELDIAIADSDLTAQQIHVEKIVIAGLQLYLRRERDGTFSVEHLFPAAPASKPGRAKHPKPEEHPGPRFTIDHVALENAAIDLRDEAVEPALETEIRGLSVTVRGLSNHPGTTAHESVRLHVRPNLSLSQEGTLRLAPLEAKGKLDVEGIEPARFAPYFQDKVAFDLIRGRLGLGGAYLFEQAREQLVVRVSDAFLTVGDLAARRRGAGNAFFKLDALAVRGVDADLDAHTVKVAQISTSGGRLRATRDAHGIVDLATLVPPTLPSSSPSRPPATAEPAPPWVVGVSRVELDGWGARFDDHAVKPDATLTVDPIALHLTNVSTAPGASIGFALRLGVNKTGTLQMTGTSTLPPISANVHFDLRGLDIVPLQPYFQDQMSLAVTNGNVSAKGQATVKVGAGSAPKVNVTTDVDIADLATVDLARQEALLKWRSFHVGGLHLTSPPMALAIDQISLTDFASRLILFPDAHFNLQDALAAPGAGTASQPAPAPEKKRAAHARAAPAAPSPLVTIKSVTLQGGQVAFRDRLIHPSYAADLTDLAGRVTGLSSSPHSTADIDLRGSVNHSGVLTIVGRVNPLAQDLSLDVAVNLKDFELTPASPYTAKYAGYAISKGKLDLSLVYKIAHGKLDAQNELVLDQFTFGDRVDSPTAVKLPLRLAVALLKDRHGVIDINLPIAGSLDDPEFKIWHAVLKVLGNLVVKAVTAPFSLIASAFGGGDDVSTIPFPAGATALDATASKRLGVIAKVLQERPGVSFEIEGQADPAREREALRRYLFERKLKAKKIAESVKAGAAVPAALDDLAIDTADRPRLIAAVYKSETFPKPTNALGLEKTLAAAEMEKLILVNTNVDDEALRALAQRRAMAVENTLIKAAIGAGGRLFLVAPQLATSGGRVALKLKKD
jgi:uncharacterized protein involved in outer membrane biogenesis